MFYPQNDPHSEVKRDQLVQSSLDYWSSASRLLSDIDPYPWEAGGLVQVKAGPWVLLVLAIIIALALFVFILL